MLASGLAHGQRHMGQWITHAGILFGLLAEIVRFPHFRWAIEEDFGIDAAVDHGGVGGAALGQYLVAIQVVAAHVFVNWERE